MSDLLDQCMRRTMTLLKAAGFDREISPSELKEIINASYTTAMLKLVASGQNNIRPEVIVTVPASAVQVSLSTTSTPAIPSMIAPIRLWERPSGGTAWVPMQKVMDHLPVNATPGNTLCFWEWRNGTLNFVGSTLATDVKIHYGIRATEFSLPRDTFAVPDLVNPVSFSAASTILGGNQYYDARYADEIRLLEAIDSHLDNITPVRMKRRRSGIRRY